MIAFDSTVDRTRVVKVLSGYAYRVQKSVFEGLISKESLEEMRTKLEKIIDMKTIR